MNLIDHLEKLKYFYETAKFGSLKKASESVFISQPSLSKSIKILEDAIGSPLFIRQPRGVALTEEGELLYSYCKKLFLDLSDIQNEIESLESDVKGKIRIGTFDSIAIYFWPKFLKSFMTKYKNIEVQLVTGRSSDIQDMLEAGEIDIALIINPNKKRYLKTIKLKEDHFKFYESTKSKKVYNSLVDAPLISMRTSLISQESLDYYTNNLNLSSNFFSVNSLEAIKALVIQGIGIGLLPELVAKNLVNTAKVKEVSIKDLPKKGIFPHTLNIVFHEYRKESSLINTIVNEIKNTQI